MQMKKRRAIMISIAISLLLGTLLSGCAVPRAKIVTIPLSGTISSSQQGLLIGPSVTPDLVRDYLERAERDPLVRAVVLRINSPGGSAAASQEVSSEISDFKEGTGKPVVVSMGDVAASGGYYISAHADVIVANPGTLTGSIGVISQFIYIDGLLEKLGLERETIKAGEHKDMGIRELTDEERRIMQEITDDVYRQFIDAVAEGRGMLVEEVEALATGQLYTGNQALELGLVDELGGLSEAIELAASRAGITDFEIEEYGQQGSFLAWLLQTLQSPFFLPLSGDELLFLRMLEGWQGMPKY
jgi:protease-4